MGKAVQLSQPEDDDDDHRDVIALVTNTVVGIEDLPVIPGRSRTS